MRSFLLLLPLVLFSCENSQPEETKKDSPAVVRAVDTIATTVKKDTVTDSITKQPVQQADTLRGTVRFNLSYCGGAAPTMEVIEELKKYHALPSSVIILKKSGVRYVISTNENGEFAAALPEGWWSTAPRAMSPIRISPRTRCIASRA